MSSAITLVDVSARDGLQNEPKAAQLSAADKVAFIRLLCVAGLKRIEAGSFVRPQAVPAMANSAEVAALLATVAQDFPQVVFYYLVPNSKGLERAEAVHAREIAVFLAVSEQFSRANINMGVDEAFAAIEPTVKAAQTAGIRVRGYISNLFGYTDLPFSPLEVARRTQQLLDMGCFEISLGDTTGIGTPEMVEDVIGAMEASDIPLASIAMHFHDTFGKAIRNVERSYALGIRTFDAATGGLGGCPYANSPKGNLAMEDILTWCAQKSIDCGGISLNAVRGAADFIHDKLNQTRVA